MTNRFLAISVVSGLIVFAGTWAGASWAPGPTLWLAAILGLVTCIGLFGGLLLAQRRTGDSLRTARWIFVVLGVVMTGLGVWTLANPGPAGPWPTVLLAFTTAFFYFGAALYRST